MQTQHHVRSRLVYEKRMRVTDRFCSFVVLVTLKHTHSSSSHRSTALLAPSVTRSNQLPVALATMKSLWLVHLTLTMPLFFVDTLTTRFNAGLMTMRRLRPACESNVPTSVSTSGSSELHPLGMMLRTSLLATW